MGIFHSTHSDPSLLRGGTYLTGTLREKDHTFGVELGLLSPHLSSRPRSRTKGVRKSAIETFLPVLN